MLTTANATRQTRPRTLEIRKLRARIERLCEDLDTWLVGDLRGCDDFHLSRGAVKRRGPYAKSVWYRLEKSHPKASEAARLVAEACGVANRTGGYAKRRIVEARTALDALLNERGVS